MYEQHLVVERRMSVAERDILYHAQPRVQYLYGVDGRRPGTDEAAA